MISTTHFKMFKRSENLVVYPGAKRRVLGDVAAFKILTNQLTTMKGSHVPLFYFPGPKFLQKSGRVQNLPHPPKLQIRVSNSFAVRLQFIFGFVLILQSLLFSKSSFGKMKNREKINGSESNKMANKKKKKNMKRLGGGGLSLEAFANAKSRTNFYNPALISTYLFSAKSSSVLFLGAYTSTSCAF